MDYYSAYVLAMEIDELCTGTQDSDTPYPTTDRIANILYRKTRKWWSDKEQKWVDTPPPRAGEHKTEDGK